MNHRFFIMPDGVASVRRAVGSTVYGLLWDLALADVAALDRFEEIGRGLYRKVVQPVVKQAGTARAVLYVGHSVEEGRPRPGYLEGVIAAAGQVPLPAAYLRMLSALLGQARPSGRRPFDPVTGARPRFTAPSDAG